MNAVSDAVAQIDGKIFPNEHSRTGLLTSAWHSHRHIDIELKVALDGRVDFDRQTGTAVEVFAQVILLSDVMRAVSY